MMRWFETFVKCSVSSPRRKHGAQGTSKKHEIPVYAGVLQRSRFEGGEPDYWASPKRLMKISGETSIGCEFRIVGAVSFC